MRSLRFQSSSVNKRCQARLRIAVAAPTNKALARPGKSSFCCKKRKGKKALRTGSGVGLSENRAMPCVRQDEPNLDGQRLQHVLRFALAENRLARNAVRLLDVQRNGVAHLGIERAGQRRR